MSRSEFRIVVISLLLVFHQAFQPGVHLTKRAHRQNPSKKESGETANQSKYSKERDLAKVDEPDPSFQLPKRLDAPTDGGQFSISQPMEYLFSVPS